MKLQTKKVLTKKFLEKENDCRIWIEFEDEEEMNMGYHINALHYSKTIDWQKRID